MFVWDYGFGGGSMAVILYDRASEVQSTYEIRGQIFAMLYHGKVRSNDMMIIQSLLAAGELLGWLLPERAADAP
jgi:hypothetical protein